MELHNRYFGILGLGISGMSLVKFLKKNQLNFICWDDHKNGDHLTNMESAEWGKISDLIVSPGIGADHFLVQKLQAIGVNIYSDIELFYQIYQCRNKIIAITGTNGKSTTTALISHIINNSGRLAAIGGNFGIPIFDINPDDYDFLVLELSSFQLDRTKDFAAATSILINITKDHLDYHGSMANYIASKEKIFHNMDKDGLAIICIDGDYTKEIASTIKTRLVTVSKKQIPNNIPDNISLKGQHNIENILISIAACHNIGIEDSKIIDGIASYKGLPHRMEYVGEKNGVIYINDSKATNFDSSLHALSAFKNIHWIIGGIAKEGGIEGFEQYLANIKQVYITGQAQKEFAGYIGDKIIKHLCQNLGEAVLLAQKHAIAGDVVLLSPACSSLDQWKNFAARGDAFKKYVGVDNEVY